VMSMPSSRRLARFGTFELDLLEPTAAAGD
jgi:hypothetical protein